MPRRRKKKRTHKGAELDGAEPVDAGPKVPKSFVFKRGKVDQLVQDLTLDMRRVMEPNTAIKLKERKNNQLKDFLSVAPSLNVTHFMIFSQTKLGVNLRVIRIPRGPTCTFRVLKYANARDVIKIQKKPYTTTSEFMSAPLVVLSNFRGDSPDKQIMSAMFQNMFPALDVASVKLNACRRVVLFHYDEASKTIQFRHYVVTASPVGINKAVKKVIKARIPKLGALEDIADYVFGQGPQSDSEMDDTPDTRVTLAQDFAGRGNKSAQKSAVRLKELGPRMSLQLLKIEEEVCDGNVLFHSLKEKTEPARKAAAMAKARKASLKEQRRAEQEKNVAAKKAGKTQKKERRKLRRLQKQGLVGSDDEDDSDEDDDAKEQEPLASAMLHKKEPSALGHTSDEETSGPDGYGLDNMVTSEIAVDSTKRKAQFDETVDATTKKVKKDKQVMHRAKRQQKHQQKQRKK